MQIKTVILEISGGVADGRGCENLLAKVCGIRLVRTNRKSKALLCHPTPMRYWLNKNTTVIRIKAETNI